MPIKHTVITQMTTICEHENYPEVQIALRSFISANLYTMPIYLRVNTTDYTLEVRELHTKIQMSVKIGTRILHEQVVDRPDKSQLVDCILEYLTFVRTSPRCKVCELMLVYDAGLCSSCLVNSQIDGILEKCCICMEFMRKDVQTYELRCNKHAIHGRCFSPLIEKCPICRCPEYPNFSDSDTDSGSDAGVSLFTVNISAVGNANDDTCSCSHSPNAQDSDSDNALIQNDVACDMDLTSNDPAYNSDDPTQSAQAYDSDNIARVRAGLSPIAPSQLRWAPLPGDSDYSNYVTEDDSCDSIS